MLDALTRKTVPSRPTMPTRDVLDAHIVSVFPASTQVKWGMRWGRTLTAASLLGGLLLIAAGPSCKNEGNGDPCTPEQEYDQTFLGFDEKEVNVESKSFQCRTRLCLVNHFRGRASCPYGQGTNGDPPTGSTKACTVPGNVSKIEGGTCDGSGGKTLCQSNADCGTGVNCTFADKTKQSSVSPQCIDRAADKAVYCSCRCADINGQTPSDQTFCTCPDGFQCQRLVTSIGQGNEGLTGSYCIKTNTLYDPTTACTQGDCDPADKARQCASQ